jgi:hypothetical protein
MMDAGLHRFLADVVLVIHFGFVAFVIGGLVLIICGGYCGWGWIRNRWFRALHLAAIAVVVIPTWFEIICPLTTLEMYLREKAGEGTYGGTFISYWLRRLLFYDAPPWVFNTAYTLFGLAVVGTWLKFRPAPFKQSRAVEALTQGNRKG